MIQHSLMQAITQEYALPLFGVHGVSHWARVLENGRLLCRETGADFEVVSLFAVFHDSKRKNEDIDPLHGQRGADFAAELHGTFFTLDNHHFDILYEACVGHTHECHHSDITIQACWDADRLDLGRVGIHPHPSRLCSNFAEQPKVIEWADRRSTTHYVPDFVKTEWGVGNAKPLITENARSTSSSVI